MPGLEGEVYRLSTELTSTQMPPRGDGWGWVGAIWNWLIHKSVFPTVQQRLVITCKPSTLLIAFPLSLCHFRKLMPYSVFLSVKSGISRQNWLALGPGEDTPTLEAIEVCAAVKTSTLFTPTKKKAARKERETKVYIGFKYSLTSAFTVLNLSLKNIS